jgi:hypothetical protein
LEHHQLVQAVVPLSSLRAALLKAPVSQVSPVVAGHAAFCMDKPGDAEVVVVGAVKVAGVTFKVPMKVAKAPAVSQQAP